MSHIAISIRYGGLTLPVVKRADGEEIVPLKPIADMFGLSWEDQRKKVVGSAYLVEFLGVCTGDIPGAGSQVRNQTCILLRRVAAYLMTLNPDKVRAAGNVKGAAFLIAKQEEWADALHDYEELGAAINLNHQRTKLALANALTRVVAARSRTENKADRDLLGQLLSSMATDAGFTYQLELPTP